MNGNVARTRALGGLTLLLLSLAQAALGGEPAKPEVLPPGSFVLRGSPVRDKSAVAPPGTSLSDLSCCSDASGWTHEKSSGQIEASRCSKCRNRIFYSLFQSLGSSRTKSQMKPLPAPHVRGDTDAERFSNALRATLTVSKEEILKREAKWKRARTRKKRAKKTA